ncbi:hypothetical protein chiPu_0011976 [Chiloscyllium punctatum]|uniref:Uncharacterized protein n=1 Tax=Chiloscyllium punctatum TaxID=137246 RepID=A0A401ST05_CHIPU|nr:hypothetical protein [Chiloscyllium punctatum]
MEIMKGTIRKQDPAQKSGARGRMGPTQLCREGIEERANGVSGTVPKCRGQPQVTAVSGEVPQARSQLCEKLAFQAGRCFPSTEKLRAYSLPQNELKILPKINVSDERDSG